MVDPSPTRPLNEFDGVVLLCEIPGERVSFGTPPDRGARGIVLEISSQPGGACIVEGGGEEGSGWLADVYFEELVDELQGKEIPTPGTSVQPVLQSLDMEEEIAATLKSRPKKRSRMRKLGTSYRSQENSRPETSNGSDVIRGAVLGAVIPLVYHQYWASSELWWLSAILGMGAGALGGLQGDSVVEATVLAVIGSGITWILFRNVELVWLRDAWFSLAAGGATGNLLSSLAIEWRSRPTKGG